MAEGATHVGICAKTRQYAAFTLAEVLITLAIIGVVAAMTIPTLVNNYQEKQTITKLKVAQNTFYNALRLAEVENGSIESWTQIALSEECSLKIASILKKYLRISKDCGIDDSKGACIYSGFYKRLDGATHDSYANGSPYYAYKVVLSNGTSIFWHGQNNTNALSFFVDTNGPSQPNVFGRDLFLFRYANGELVPLGAPGYDDYETHCASTSSTGYGCTYYVLTYNNMDYLKN